MAKPESFDLSELGVKARVPVAQLTLEEQVSYASQCKQLWVVNTDGMCDFTQFQPQVRTRDHRKWAEYCRDCYHAAREAHAAAAKA